MKEQVKRLQTLFDIGAINVEEMPFECIFNLNIYCKCIFFVAHKCVLSEELVKELVPEYFI